MSERRPVELGLSHNRLLVVATGSIGSAHIAQWISAIDEWYPHVEVRVVLTYSAQQFASRALLAIITRNEVLGPDWPKESARVIHKDIAGWPDAIAVMPATANTIAKLAAGIADSFALTILQSAACPIVIAPAVPEQVAGSPIFASNVQRLADSGFHVLETVSGKAASSGENANGGMASLPRVLTEIAVAARARAISSDLDPISG